MMLAKNTARVATSSRPARGQTVVCQASLDRVKAVAASVASAGA